MRLADSKRSADIEVSEAIYNYKTGFMEILIFRVASTPNKTKTTRIGRIIYTN